MVKTLASLAASTAAYTLVDISELDEELRKDILEDAGNGGGRYGVRVVEEAVNGPARSPIYGVYNDGPDADRWADAKKKLGISGTDVDDAEVRATAAGNVDDPRREAAIREAAAQRVAGVADRIRAGEDADVDAIVNGGADVGGTSSATDNHATNVVDTTLASDASNEVSKTDDTTDEAPARTTRRTNRAPR